MASKEIVGTTATVLTILQFLCGSLICRKIVQQGNTSGISGFNFVCGVFNCGSWLIYGSLLSDTSMSVTNGVGAFTQLCYVAVYFFYCTPSSKTIFKKQLLGLVVVMSSIVYYVYYSGIPIDTVKHYIGMLVCFASISFCSSPLASLAEVIKSRSTASLPFPLLVLMFLVVSSWTFYGHIIGNMFVVVPNFICMLIASAQLSLFLIYPNSPSPKHAKGSTEELM